MKKLDNLYRWSSFRAATCLCAIFIICVIAGCGTRDEAQIEVERFADGTGIKLPASFTLEHYLGLSPGRDGPRVYFKIVTDKAGFESTVASLPKTSLHWKDAKDFGNAWSRLSSKDRLGISNHFPGISYDLEQPPPPSWWRPDSIGNFVASAGNVLDHYWTLVGGRDASGRCVIYAFYFES